MGGFGEVRVLAVRCDVEPLSDPHGGAAAPGRGALGEGSFARLSLLYSELHVAEVRPQIQERKKARDWDGVEEVMGRYLDRMWDLSQFMKTLKQRFAQWFNKWHGRRVILWEVRFKSVIVEDGYVAQGIAAYIDLNPVRVGMVNAPEKYRWSSYAEALAGIPCGNGLRK